MENKFKDRLKAALKFRNKKAVDLSNDTGLSQALISQYLNGKFEPKNDRLSLIAEYLDVNPLYLMGWVDEFGTYDSVTKTDVENPMTIKTDKYGSIEEISFQINNQSSPMSDYEYKEVFRDIIKLEPDAFKLVSDIVKRMRKLGDENE